MKKLFRIFINLVSCLGFIAAANAVVFKIKGTKVRGRGFRFYEYKYGKIRYTVKGTGKPVLLVHGTALGDSIEEWNGNINGLSERFKVYAIDLLGYGGSEKPPVSYSSYMYTGLINDFISNVIKKKVCAVGSCGSAAFLCAAAKLCPENFEKLLLISPERVNPVSRMPVFVKNAVRTLIESPVIGTAIYNVLCSKALMAAYLEKILRVDRYTAKRLAKQKAAVTHNAGSNARFAAAALYSGMLDTDVSRHITHAEHPILIVSGENEGEEASLEKLCINSRSASLTVCHDCESLPHAENPAQFNRECIVFFEQE